MKLEKIEVTTTTNGRYGRVKPGDILVVGADIDEVGAKRWVKVGIAKPTNLKKKRSEPKPKEVKVPTAKNTVKQIKAHLDSNKVEYKANLTKDELLALCNEES